MKIDIITDGNNKLGMGHVYQVITLVRYLLDANSNLDIRLYTKSDQSVISLLEATNCKVKACLDDREIYNFIRVRCPDSVIFDKLDVSPILAKKIKNNTISKLFIFTNLTDANKYADVTLMAGISDNFQNIRNNNDISGKIEFFGPKYWILRPEFLEIKANVRKTVAIKKILLIFGGSDPSNFSSRVLEKIFGMQGEFELSLVLGVGFMHEEELNEAIKYNTSLSSVNIFRGISNVAEMMSINDVVFASPGLTYFESLSVGTPVLGFHQNKMQKDVFNDHLPTLGLENLNDLYGIIKNEKFIFPSDPFIKNMQIGHGITEIIDQILIRK